MVHALGNIQDVPPFITVHEQQVSTVEEFVYLVLSIHSTTQKHTRQIKFMGLHKSIFVLCGHL